MRRNTQVDVVEISSQVVLGILGCNLQELLEIKCNLGPLGTLQTTLGTGDHAFGMRLSIDLHNVREYIDSESVQFS